MQCSLIYGTLGLFVTIAHKCLGSLSLVFWAEQECKADGQERNHAPDQEDNEAQCKLFSPGLLHLLVREATHSHKRRQGPAGRDPRTDHPAGGWFILFTLLEQGFGRLEAVWSREGLAATERASSTDSATASTQLTVVHGSPRHGYVVCGCGEEGEGEGQTEREKERENEGGDASVCLILGDSEWTTGIGVSVLSVSDALAAVLFSVARCGVFFFFFF